MSQAIQELASPQRKTQNNSMKELQELFITQITEQISQAKLTGSVEKRLPNNVHVRFAGVQAHDLVMLLDQKGIASSVGSACSEKTQEPSHVLLSMGLSEKEANSAIRFTLGKDTTKKEIHETVKYLAESVAQLQKN
jgi:cysteine desulfurase